MKKIEIKNIITILAILLLTVSCNDWIDHDINVDPDSPSDVPMSLILPGIQQSMGYNLVGNNTVRTNNIWMQHFDGTDRQSYTEARYQLTPADVDGVWSSIYTEMIMNSNTIIEKSKAEGKESPHYEGIAQVMIATSTGIATDLFGDIPFSKAFGGNQGILKAEYDSQEKVYDTIFQILDKAITNLSSTNNTISVDGDVSYGGDIDKWKKAAYSIKARHALQLSAINGNAAYTEALTAASKGFSSNDDDFMVPWEEANKNPLFQFMEQRGDIRMGATFVDLLNSVNDPRLPFYVAKDGDGNYTGSAAGSENTSASEPGSYIAGSDSSTNLMTYSELKFIQAEAYLMLNDSRAQKAWEDAVAASVLRVTGNDNSTWLTANIIGVPVTLEKIIEQKYIDGIGTNQPYADYRRTGLPNLNIATGAVLSSIPTRFPYATSELNYNSENVPTVTISDKLWWDQ
ncbi:MAG: SusD/RagB family nutrient-binding outer membrane lipoprotein [Polaribacter sp.]|uniref:SusD/RagB family nutrient-binding outer membrane lipoprotein n=1 Tax=Polaribacter sp. TaxID=1920175 RepID=UPI003264DFD2